MTVYGYMRWALACVAGGVLLVQSALAQDRGPVTNLPLPRYVSLKTDEGNVRRGPSLSHRIDWIFVRRGMPLEIVGEFGHWRRVQDRDGVGGWIHYSLLSGVRTGLIEADLTAVMSAPSPDSPIKAYLEAGVIVAIDSCAADWCKVQVEGTKGWMEKTALWGVRRDEIFD